jgi:cyclopropane fatty-acyl-phospholipid synthase-like methyltransferase
MPILSFGKRAAPSADRLAEMTIVGNGSKHACGALQTPAPGPTARAEVDATSDNHTPADRADSRAATELNRRAASDAGTYGYTRTQAFSAVNGSHVKAPATVVECYDFLDRFLPECGLWDLTDGMYDGDPNTPHEQAQSKQVGWLLDQVHCQRGSRILEIGCGNGRLLQMAGERGAGAIGVNVSRLQVEQCRARGLDARLMSYREIDETWNGRFDAVICNGSIEHFVQAEDVRAGRGDDIYRELFEICHRVIDPASPSRRMTTTTIHLNERTPKLAPDEITKSPFAFLMFSDKFHYAMVTRCFGGSYPHPGQFERCASPYFRLLHEVDGTLDYHLTSEEWLRRGRRTLLIPGAPAFRIWRGLLPLLFRQPRHAATMALCLFVTDSWQRQFRGEHPPTTLLRKVWEYTGV